MSDRVDQFVEVTPALKRALIREAQAQNVTVNDAAVGILAASYSVPFDLSGQEFREVGTSTDLVLKMPVALRRKIKMRAAGTDRSIRSEIEATLAAFFDARAVA